MTAFIFITLGIALATGITVQGLQTAWDSILERMA